MLSKHPLQSLLCQTILFLPLSVLPIQAQADLSVTLPDTPGKQFKTQLTPHSGYSVSHEVDSTSGTRIQLKRSDAATEGEATLEYQSIQRENGSHFKWSGRSREATPSGNPVTPPSPYPPNFPAPPFPVIPQAPMPVPPPPFPMKMEFPFPPQVVPMPPIPPEFQQPCLPAIPYPPAMPQPPAFPSLPMPSFPAGAHAVTSATGTGDIDYSQSSDGRSKSLTWSSSSSVSTQSSWPPSQAGTLAPKPATTPKINHQNGTRSR